MDSSSKHLPVNVGDALVLAPNTRFTFRPEGSATTTTLYIEVEYLIDQLFWRNSDVLVDRSETWEFISARFPDSTRVFNIGIEQVVFMEPWIDRLVELSVEGPISSRFFRVQADLASVLDVLDPYFERARRDEASMEEMSQSSSTQWRTPGSIRHEACTMRAQLESNLTISLTLKELAKAVHLSPSQAHKVFVEAYGHTPLAYQTHLRVDEMARLLNSTNSTIQDIAHSVGWKDRSHAAHTFRSVMGVNPQQYRQALKRRG